MEEGDWKRKKWREFHELWGLQWWPSWRSEVNVEGSDWACWPITQERQVGWEVSKPYLLSRVKTSKP